MVFLRNYLILCALLMIACLSAIFCNKSSNSDSGAPSRRTNAVIVSGNDTTGISQAVAWINGALIPLGDGINPSEANRVRVLPTTSEVLFPGYQNNGLIDKAYIWHYKDGKINAVDIGQGPIAGYSSRANWISIMTDDRYYYVAGTYTPAGDWAIFWKIDAINKTVESIPLSDISQAPASAYMTRKNSTDHPVIVCGSITSAGVQTACYWFNPAPGSPNITLVGDGINPSNAFLVGPWVDGVVRPHGFQNDGANDRACIWNNLGLNNVGTVGRDSMILGAYSDLGAGVGSDNTAYLCGYETNAAGRDVACYWAFIPPALPPYPRYDLGQADRDSRALGVWVFEGRVYVTGYEYSAAGAAAGTREACIWINDAASKTVLSPGRAGTGTQTWDPYFNTNTDSE